MHPVSIDPTTYGAQALTSTPPFLESPAVRGNATCCGVPWEIAALVALAVSCTGLLVDRAVASELELHFLTYWGIISVAAFSCAWLVCILVDTRRGTASITEPLLVATVALPVVAVQGLVVVLITAIPIMDPNILVALAGTTQLGVANFLNILVHYAPFVILVFVLQSRVERWREGLRLIFGAKAVPRGQGGDRDVSVRFLKAAMLFSQAFAFPLFLSGVYSSIFDFNTSYQVNIPHGDVYLVGVIFVLVFYITVLSLARDV